MCKNHDQLHACLFKDIFQPLAWPPVEQVGDPAGDQCSHFCELSALQSLNELNRVLEMVTWFFRVGDTAILLQVGGLRN